IAFHDLLSPSQVALQLIQNCLSLQQFIPHSWDIIWLCTVSDDGWSFSAI
ncbi:hypothetical protein A2U01_0102860, partial [Trifolium medium]|nr:hypothetical protein [Trifolium medium]